MGFSRTTRSSESRTPANRTKFAYDEMGRQTRVTNPDLSYSVSMFDKFGHLTKSTSHASGASAFAATEQVYDVQRGLVTKVYQYHDPANNITASSAGDIITESLYTAAGRLTKTLDPNANATVYDYDSLGRQITVTDAATNKQIVIYDNADRALTQRRLDYDGANHVTFTTVMAYDSRNRVTMVVDPNNSLTQKTFYDAIGQVTQTQDPAGMKVATTYDRIGRLTRTTEDVDGIARYTDRLYDRAGRLTRLVGYTADATGAQNTDYAYNKAGVLTRSTYPDDTSGGGGDRGYVEHFYDAVLRLTKVTDQEAQDTVIVYDSMSRRTAITKGTEVDTFAYNTAGQVTLARRGTSANPDATSQSERLYDGLLRLTREAQSVKESTARNVDYAYDDAGNVITLGYPNGAAIATSYTANNQRNVISRGGSQLADYDYVGYRPKSLIYETGANDVTLTNSYDAGGRMTRMAYAQSGNTTLPDFSYTFDAASNILTKKFEHRSGTPSEAYQYDTLHRLTHTVFNQRTSTPYESFVYDDLGNHLTQNNNGTTIAGLFNSVNEQTKRAGTDVLYDKKGNLTKDDTSGGGQVYFYDRQNLLTRVEDGSSNRIASYAYDAFNRRIEKDVNGGDVTRFYWNGWQTIEETDDAGTPAVQRYYVWGNYIDELLMFRDVIGTGGTANADYFACRHHNYNIVALLNTSGGVMERYDYNPYGQRFVLNPDYTDDGDGLSDFGLTLGHQGLMHDEESGLVYNRWRMLHTGLDRFMQRDPANRNQPVGGYHDGMNAYEYVGNSPVRINDASGLRRQPTPQGVQNCKMDGYRVCGERYPHWWQYHLYVGCVNGVNAGCEDVPFTGSDVSVDAGLLVGIGVAKLSCCDDKQAKHSVILKKVCGGVLAGVSASAHVLTNISGKNCPSAYQGYFFEWAAGIGVVGASGEVGVFSEPGGSVKGGGGYIGVGIPVEAKLCHYTIVSDDIDPCGCE